MSEEHDEKVKDLLADIQEGIRERRAAQFVKRVKKGRAAIFIVALMYTLSLARGIVIYEHGSDKLAIYGCIAVIFFVLFLVSLQRPYISLLSASIVYFLASTYSVANDVYMYRIAVRNELFSMLQMGVIISVLIRLLILFFLFNGANYARKLEAIEKGLE